MKTRGNVFSATFAAVLLSLVLPPSTYATGTAYVALGDSYSAGTGTRAPIDECYRSPFGYPALIAERQGLDLDYQACGGAVIADVQHTQIDALDADTSYVTMTIGGNDLGFSDAITECIQPWWISDCDEKIDHAEEVLTGLMPDRYDALFDTITDRAPQAKVVIGGYPHLFNGENCFFLTFFSRNEMRRINATADALNELIDDRSSAYGFGYVDPREAFDGHVVCDDTPWINNLTLPLEESYHPNRAGNRAYADVFWPTSLQHQHSSDLESRAESSEPLSLWVAAYVLLALDLTSRENLREAQAAGVNTSTLRLAVQQLASHEPAIVTRGIDTLQMLNDEEPEGLTGETTPHEGGPVSD